MKRPLRNAITLIEAAGKWEVESLEGKGTQGCPCVVE